MFKVLFIYSPNFSSCSIGSFKGLFLKSALKMGVGIYFIVIDFCDQSQ